MNDFQVFPSRLAIQHKDGGWVANIDPYWTSDNGIDYIRSVYVTLTRASYIPSVREVTEWMIAIRKQFNISAPESPKGPIRAFTIIKDEDLEAAVSAAMNRYGFTTSSYSRFTYYTEKEGY